MLRNVFYVLSMKDMLNKYNKKYVSNDFRGNILEESVFSYVEKNTFVCLSAPHSVKSFVSNKVKKSDLFTGALVNVVGEEYGFSYLIREKFVDYKCRIDDFVLKNGLENHYFLDIHGMKDNDDFDLAVGIGYADYNDYEEILAKIDELASKYGIRYVINHPSYMGRVGFTGKFQQKIGKYNVVQLEWSKIFRDFNNKIETVEGKTIPFLVELAKYIEVKG